MRTAEATNIFPVYNVENDCILSMQGDITLAYEIELPEIFTLSEKDYDAIHQCWIKAIRVLPASSILHKQDWFIRDKHKVDSDKADSFLSRSSERFFNGRSYLGHNCYLFLTKKPEDRRLSTSAYCNLLRKSIVPAHTINPVLTQSFIDSAGQFTRILQDSGYISVRRLTDDELSGTANHAGIIERYCFLLDKGQPSLLQDVQIDAGKGLTVGNNACELYTLSDVEDLPSLCGSRINYDKYSTDRTKFSVGFASPLGQLLDCNHIYNQYVFIGNAQKTIKALEQKRLRLQSLSSYSRENAISRDAVNDFLNEAISQQRLPVKAHFNILAWADNEIKQDELKNLVTSALAQMDAVAKLETSGAPQIWWAGLPGNQADFPQNDSFDTFAEQATCFFNLETNYRSDNDGIRFGERIYGRPVSVDLFNVPMRKGIITNRNMFVCGGSGGGKSMTMNHMLRTLYEQQAHCVVIDVGGSYKGLCDLLEGYYFVYTEENPIQFNPFYLTDGDTLDTEKKENLKTLLLALWKKSDESYKRSEYVAISNALSQYYQLLDRRDEIFPCFNSFYDFLKGDYRQTLREANVKDSDFDFENFLYVLAPYYGSGEFGYLLNATKNLDMLNERFIVFELDNLKSHPILFPVVTIVIMSLFIEKMRKLKGLRKVLAIDEAWIAIAKSGMAEFIKYLYKTIRKFNGIAALITQEVDDLISSPIIKETVVNLSDTKVFLDMRKFLNKFDSLQRTLGLSDKLKELLLSLNRANDPLKNYRELLIDQGGEIVKVLRNELSIEEYLAYSTEETEKIKVQDYADRYGSLEKGIAALAKEMRASQ